ncbi:beta-1,6-N-acetylglucosaminyltransferase [Runella sp.]|uniref:beta-1,6-N-acetylglucosaminyltransferase n=1 Tax=Runella sp. TaxID=1960881 RepID=UPI003D0EF359
MKVAHLILAHAQPLQLARLINSLQHPEADFYIHLDQKADIAPFLEAVQGKNVFFVKQRVKVRWGAYSMVQATLNGFEDILASGVAYQYVNLLSGQDYPLQKPTKIHSFLDANYPKQYMEFFSVEKEWKEAIPRLTRYHLVNFDIPLKFKIEEWINKILPDRKMPNHWVAVGRSQWFTITLDAVRYIVDHLKKNPQLVRFFKLTWGVDELIFQTVLYNSALKPSMVNENLRYIDWSEGKSSPKTLTIEDKTTLSDCGKFFARKFNSEVDEGILNHLDSI